MAKINIDQGLFERASQAAKTGGYSSLEKHAHTHAVICVRGRGILSVGDELLQLNPLDVAYVPPLHVHQLRNESTEPFGFFCIVDHERDRPQAP